MHNPYALSCAGAALDELHRWDLALATQASEQYAEGNRRLVRDTDPLTNPNAVNHEAQLHHYAKEVWMQLERERNANAQAAITAWRQVCKHRGREGADELVRSALVATARVYPRARRILDRKPDCNLTGY